MATELEIAIDPVGPDERSLQQFSRTLMVHPRLQDQLSNADFRLLSFELIDPAEKSDQPPPPDRYRATLYDYTGNRTLFAEGSMGTPDVVEITESGIQPLPSAEEFAAAVDVLSQHDEIGTLLREQVARPYQPMPPLLQEELPDGRVERTITVGLLPVGDRDVHEIVGVNLITRAVVRFPNRAPATATAGGLCGLPPAGQPTASKGTPGQVWVTVSQAGTVLWRFLVVRPAASSGTNGSGVELRFVDYRGKRLLYRAHVPILNVKYSAPPCGPYLDWQYAEGMIQATGGDVAPGFRLCPTPAQTILNTGDDKGNFLGVAIYVDGEEVVLVSELQAGWYRYISMWRLHADGTIRPRFGFSGTSSGCVCTAHDHHAYWRLDFDVATPGDNRVQEFNEPPLFGTSNWHTKKFEIQRARDPSRARKWRVDNKVTGDAYDIVPGTADGVATASPDWPFPQGDVWVVKYKSTEIDNGVVATGPPHEANIGNFVNGEAVDGADVVVWYAAHVTHDISAEPPGVFGHIAGPDVKLVNW